MSQTIQIEFHLPQGTSTENVITTHIPLVKGETLLDVAQAESQEEQGIYLEGACGGALACSTCHVILSPEWYTKLGEPSNDENDMLDLAHGVTECSRLACQIKITPDLDGLSVTIPQASRNWNR